MSVKFKESTQWYKFFYGATAKAKALYHKNMTKNMALFNIYKRNFVEKLWRHAQLDWYNYR